MGRHSRKGPAPRRSDSGQRPSAAGGPPPGEGPPRPQPPAEGQDRAAPAYGTPAHGVPRVRGGHPEHREPGGGWGDQQRYGDRPGATPGRPPYPQGPGGPTRDPMGPGGPTRGARQDVRSAPPAQRRFPGPRREFVEAFDAPPTPRTRPDPYGTGRDADDARWRPDPYASVADWDDENSRPGAASTALAGDSGRGSDRDGPMGLRDADGAGERPVKGGLGRTFTGIAAMAVTTVLAVVVAGQVGAGGGPRADALPAGGLARDGEGAASRSDGRPTPQEAPVAKAPAPPPTFGQLMARQFPLAADLSGPGEFDAVPGLAGAPGEGRKVRYRIDVEKGLGLDPALFADAVHKTLNDERSWAHDGAMTFERIAGGSPDFVITLASPRTTAEWCAKSGLDTTVDNVSCDSASTDRVMINAFRWAQGAKTYGPKAMLTYRQMLINHEIGHRLGHDHVSCRTPGSLAPVMQQQTKTLSLDGVTCKPNPWPFPGS
ncbi:DUF3152 domain-containing protein [Streptomyces sp. NBC_01498]|uniref:DUF3152 domain-containing protein n=1 Tax=Streptomyces sp. NBC_01498 TaxID=2975870 RepID=UPI002E7AB05C|nr:DUF3152 domain-containing protein [Streptomyces sp. NBC_01498]WTL24763.1 DUF3152 domain-containing protein [Streptomyces sp. NBC_01498]